MLQLDIDGIPVPWASHQGFGRRSFNPRFKERAHVQWQIKAQYQGPIISGPVYVRYVFHMPIPKSASKYKQCDMQAGYICHTKRPDCINLCKFYEDCLKKIVVADDSQVCATLALKVYSNEPKTVIQIIELIGGIHDDHIRKLL